jgi:hypothetical protein
MDVYGAPCFFKKPLVDVDGAAFSAAACSDERFLSYCAVV